jgi:transketolase
METAVKKTFSDVEQIRKLALKIRYYTLLMVHHAGSSHVGTSFSMAELLAVLYGTVLRVNPANPKWPDRDRFVLSKGHGCAALYAVLAARGFFPLEWLSTFYQNGSRLAGHATHTHVPGVEVSTGSLGHGLSIASGLALAAKRDAKSYRVFAMLSDGECDEGSTWEPVLFAPQHRLDNLIAIVDYNKIQSLGHVKEVIDLDPLADKWRSFGWAVHEVDGHNVSEVTDALSQVPFNAGRPSCVIAHTVKGKGVSFMEDKLLWHYRCPNDEELHQALAELSQETNESNDDLKLWRSLI